MKHSVILNYSLYFSSRRGLLQIEIHCHPFERNFPFHVVRHSAFNAAVSSSLLRSINNDFSFHKVAWMEVVSMKALKGCTRDEGRKPLSFKCWTSSSSTLINCTFSSYAPLYYFGSHNGVGAWCEPLHHPRQFGLERRGKLQSQPSKLINPEFMLEQVILQPNVHHIMRSLQHAITYVSMFQIA